MLAGHVYIMGFPLVTMMAVMAALMSVFVGTGMFGILGQHLGYCYPSNPEDLFRPTNLTLSYTEHPAKVHPMNRPVETIVYLHGWPDHADIWEKHVDHFTGKGYKCATVSLPNFEGRTASDDDDDDDSSAAGSSHRPSQPPRFPRGPDFHEVVELVHSTIGSIQGLEPSRHPRRFRPIILVTHDWGSTVGYMLSHRYPHAVRRLVAMDVGADWDPGMKELAMAASFQLPAAFSFWLGRFAGRGGGGGGGASGEAATAGAGAGAGNDDSNGASGFAGKLAAGLQSVADSIMRATARFVDGPLRDSHPPVSAMGYLQYHYWYRRACGQLRNRTIGIDPNPPPVHFLFLYSTQMPLRFYSPTWVPKLEHGIATAARAVDWGHWLPLAPQSITLVEAWLREYEALAEAANAVRRHPEANQEWSALLLAVEKQDAQEALKLMFEGADVDRPNEDGMSPLLMASMGTERDILDALLLYGADVNATMADGSTPLIGAAHSGRKAAVRVLVAAGADLDHAMNDGVTAVQAALVEGHSQVARYLVYDAGADPMDLPV